MSLERQENPLKIESDYASTMHKSNQDDGGNFGGDGNPSRKSAAAAYIESTTIHGLSPIYAANNTALRLFWLLMFASAFSLMGWQIASLVQKLRGHDIITNVQARYNDEMPYPAVTICNANGFQKSKTAHVNGFITDNLNESELYKLGQSGEDFLLKGAYSLCNIAGDTCQFPRDFTTLSTRDLGNCFTWSSSLMQKKLGPENGLSMVVNIDVGEYSEIGTSYFSTTGAIVAVHSPDETLTYYGISNNAIYLSPGTLTNIQVKKQQMKRLPHPYPDKCFSSVHFTELSGFKLRKSFKYSAQLCQMMCYMINRYGCGYVPSYLQSIVTRLFSPEEKKFVLNYTAPDYCKTKEKCTCSPPCTEDLYQLTVSNSPWPDSLQTDAVLSTIKGSPHLTKFHHWNETFVRKNLMSFKVYYSDFTVQTVEQKPAYSSNNFLSDLGGQLGLWIGASVYSGFELCSLIFHLVTHLLTTKKKVKVDQASDR